MECSISVIRRAAQLLAVIAVTLSMTASLADDVVLVTSVDSAIEEISSLDIRKAYLGISVTIGGSTVRPLRQTDDEQLNLIFLQTVIAMSQRSYEGRLLSMTLKFGTPRPTELDTEEEMLRELTNHPHTIGYMWKSTADSNSQVKTLKVLWQDH